MDLATGDIDPTTTNTAISVTPSTNWQKTVRQRDHPKFQLDLIANPMSIKRCNATEAGTTCITSRYERVDREIKRRRPRERAAAAAPSSGRAGRGNYIIPGTFGVL
ncbi:hypothetical protein EVAR_45443_1 [Eumeta japonica]|uniref:Uncharacterized protein n=1 Tax=Eumeta variegata TaxID=151549 RepID=A0A4C1YJT5_EUMVA|nr:hypothetical protein EVAR_45443_1 [Eumeta japonica]